MVIGALVYGWGKVQRAGDPGPIANVVLRQATMQLLADGFVGCPTVQQVLELSEGPSRSELQNGMAADPWGTPFQIQCDRGASAACLPPHSGANTRPLIGRLPFRCHVSSW